MPVFETLDIIVSEVFFQAVYEILELFSIKFSKLSFTTIGVGVAGAEALGVDVVVAEGLGLGAGLAIGVKMPLLQISFFPLFTHV